MAGPVRYLIQRDGRFYARIVVPAQLRRLVGKVELSAALGSDRRTAIRALPGVVARFQDELSKAASLVAAQGKSTSAATPTRRWKPIEAARQHYLDAIAFDDELRDTTRAYSRLGFLDDRYVLKVRSIAAGNADESEILNTLKVPLAKFSATDQTQPDWRRFARVLAQAELAALDVSARRDDGEPDPPMPAFLEIAVAEKLHVPSKPSVSVRTIFKRYAEELRLIGKGRDAESRWAPVIDSLARFLGHDEASQIKRSDIIRWKDDLLKTLAPKTVRDSYLASARAAFSWATDNLHVDQNPFSGVKVRLSKKLTSREKGFNDGEARAILKASRGYIGSTKESPTMTAAKQWTPTPEFKISVVIREFEK